MTPDFLASHLETGHGIEPIGVEQAEVAPEVKQEAIEVQAKADAALRAELEALRGEIAGLKQAQIATRDDYTRGDVRESSEGSYPWQFWRHPTSGRMAGSRAGWITFTPGGRAPSGNRDVGSFNLYLKKGLIPLDEYGSCPVPKSPNASECFSVIIKKGGIREFPLSQILAYGWHRNPPMQGVTFPQYEENKDKVLVADCPECSLELFAVKGDQEMSHAFFMHLRTSHGYSRAEASRELDFQGLPVVGRFAQQSDTVMSERAKRLMQLEQEEEREKRAQAEMSA